MCLKLSIKLTDGGMLHNKYIFLNSFASNLFSFFNLIITHIFEISSRPVNSGNREDEKYDVILIDSTDPIGPAEGLFRR